MPILFVTCIKCGATQDNPWYHQFAEQCERGKFKHAVAGEHLHYRCDCGYEWTTETLDNMEVKQVG